MNILHLASLLLGGIGLVLLSNAARDSAGRIPTERIFAGPELDGGFNFGRAAVEDWLEDTLEMFFSD